MSKKLIATAAKKFIEYNERRNKLSQRGERYFMQNVENAAKNSNVFT